MSVCVRKGTHKFFTENSAGALLLLLEVCWVSSGLFCTKARDFSASNSADTCACACVRVFVCVKKGTYLRSLSLPLSFSLLSLPPPAIRNLTKTPHSNTNSPTSQLEVPVMLRPKKTTSPGSGFGANRSSRGSGVRLRGHSRSYSNQSDVSCRSNRSSCMKGDQEEEGGDGVCVCICVSVRVRQILT